MSRTTRLISAKLRKKHPRWCGLNLLTMKEHSILKKEIMVFFSHGMIISLCKYVYWFKLFLRWAIRPMCLLLFLWINFGVFIHFLACRINLLNIYSTILMNYQSKFEFELLRVFTSDSPWTLKSFNLYFTFPVLSTK